MIYENAYLGSDYCCGVNHIEEEQLVQSYWCQMNTSVMSKIEEAWKKELFGYDSECSFNFINNSHYLLDLLMYIRRDWNMNSTPEVTEIISKTGEFVLNLNTVTPFVARTANITFNFIPISSGIAPINIIGISYTSLGDLLNKIKIALDPIILPYNMEMVNLGVSGTSPNMSGSFLLRSLPGSGSTHNGYSVYLSVTGVGCPTILVAAVSFNTGRDYVAASSTKTMADYYTEWSIECIKKTFRCCGINISKALAVFGLDNSTPEVCSESVDLLLQPSSTSICSGSAFTFTPRSTYNNATICWSRATKAGITQPSASGCGAINETLTNTTNNPIDVVYVFTFTDSDGNILDTLNVPITVNPIPQLTSTALRNVTVPCSLGVVAVVYTPTSNVAGATFAWSRRTNACIVTPITSGVDIINEIVACPNGSTDMIYDVVITANGCSASYTYTIRFASGAPCTP